MKLLIHSCYSIYHGPKKKIPRLYDTMALNGQIINRQSCVKYLRLTIDETFNWGQHVSNLAKSLSKYYGIFNKIKHMIPKRHKMTIFNSFVHSKICYGIEIYGALNDCLCKRLQIICNKLLKIFFNKNPLYGTNQLHKELNTLQVKDVYKARILKFTFECLNSAPLSMFQDYYKKRSQLHNRSLRDLKNLHIPEGYSGMALSTTKIKGSKFGMSYLSILGPLMTKFISKRKYYLLMSYG